MKRRAVLLSTASLVGLSGCMGDDTSNEERAQQTVGSIASDLSVDSWELEGDTLYVEYQTTGAIRTDVEWVAFEYADAVDDGLDADLHATALGASNTFSWEVDRELADKYVGGDLSDEEFVDEVLSD